MVPIIEFYHEFLSKQLEFNAVVHSPVRKTFASASALKADAYCSAMEFQALAELVGAYGIKLIDRVILRVMARSVEQLQEQLESCTSSLKDIEACWGSDECIPTARLVIDVDGFVTKTASASKCVCLRDLLYEGLGRATKTLVPFVHDTATSLIGQYDANVAIDEELLVRLLCAAAPLFVLLTVRREATTLRKQPASSCS